MLEVLRQPLEAGKITVARANAHITYPAQFQLVAAMNPCRCGYLADASRGCGKAPKCAGEYQARLSGPLLDRIDMHLDVPAVETLQMLSLEPGESSATVAARVARARQIQRERYAKLNLPYHTNTRASGDELHSIAAPDSKGRALLEEATARFRLSMRGYTRVLRVSRTIADLEASESLQRHHIAEALAYRLMHYASPGERLAAS